MIVQDNEGRSFLDDVRAGNVKLGYGIDCELDHHIRFKRNNFVIIAGHANVGKTYFILYYYLCLAEKHGFRFCMYVAENDVEDVKWDLIELFTKTKIDKLTELQYDAAFQWVTHHFQFIAHEEYYKKNGKSLSHLKLLDMFKATGLDALVIDPWNSLHVESTGNQHLADYQAATDIRMFCKINNKCVYILAHGVTEALRKVHKKEHEYAGHTTELQAADIEGGGKWVNRADDMITIHRYTQHPTEWMYTLIHVRKVKKTRTGGKPTFLDSPVRFKLERGLYFTVNGYNPLEKKREPQQLEILDNKVLEDNRQNFYEVDKDDDDDFPF